MLVSGIKSVEDVYIDIDVWEGHHKRGLCCVSSRADCNVMTDDQNSKMFSSNISESSAVRTTHPVHEVSVGFMAQQRHPGDD